MDAVYSPQTPSIILCLLDAKVLGRRLMKVKQ